MAPRNKSNKKNAPASAAPARKPTAPAGKSGKPGKKPAAAPAAPAKKPAMSAKKQEAIQNMNLEDFLNAGDVSDVSDDDVPMADGDDESGSDYDLPSDLDEDGDAMDEDGDVSDDDAPLTDGAKHQRDLEKLKQSQPEFYQFLLENDKELLEFDGSDSEPGSDDEAEAGELAQESAPTKATLTREMLAEWETQLAQNESVAGVKRLVVAFRSVVMGDEDSESVGYTIPSASLHKRVIIATFKHVPSFLNKHVGDTPNPSSSGKWKRVAPMTKVFVTNAIKLLKDLTEPGMIEYVIQELYACVKFIAVFPKASKDYFKMLLSLWGTAKEETLRIKAFANLRHMAVTFPKKFLAPALKGVYMMFVKSSRHTNVHTLPMITLMTRCAVEIYGLVPDESYQYAFIYVRQLAIHLRNAMAMKTKESFKLVYHWQYIHSLRFWANVLLTHAPKGSTSPLAALVYPVVQVMCGVIRLVPTVQFHPLHLHLLASLTDLVRVCGTYVPLVPYYLSILDSCAQTKSKPSTLKPMYLPAFLKCPKQYLGTRVYLAGVRNAVHLGLLRYLAALAGHVAFPELAIPAVLGLKADLKATKKDPNWTKSVQSLLDKIEENRKFIMAKRSAADVAPCDAAAVAQFMAQMDPAETPLGKYWTGVEKAEQRRMDAIRGSFEGDAEAIGDAHKAKGKAAHRRDVNVSDEDDEDDEMDVSEAGEESDDDEVDEAPAPPKKKKARKQKKARRPAVEDDDGDNFLAELKGMSVVMDDGMDEDSD
ncbi:Nucleolar Complex 2 protein [Allomyces javanicus]|nr:Nucleolar Complex 2 protein [Allomyces javanicus]